ncbi:MAG: ParB N-terminal domain-containing protein [Candidatus Pacebacteria bacterium]|nr:ParB N-terminal domain-containing protein [Candidatus Paceibacterota bacterium]
MTKIAILANGSEVKVANGSEEWCATHRGFGHVAPSSLAPDPNQPRRFMNRVELAELEESIGAVGVRQDLVVTPKHLAPWIQVDEEKYENAFFIICSGHRRTVCALKRDVPAVPVIVRIYPNEAAYEEDSIVLNSQHAGLSALEQGYEIARLLKANNNNFARVGKIKGKGHSWAKRKFVLTRLAPELQDLIDPSIQVKKRLKEAVAFELGKVEVPTLKELDMLIAENGVEGELADVSIEHLDDTERRFFLQKLLLQQAEAAGGGSARMTRFIHTRVMVLPSYQGGATGKTRSAKHRTSAQRLDLLSSLINMIENSVPITWSKQDIDSILYNADSKKTSKIAARLEAACGSLDDLLDIITAASNAKPKGSGFVDTMVRVTYIGDDGLRMNEKLVPPERYITLWESGQLGFQADGTPKPEHLPDVSEVQKVVATA